MRKCLILFLLGALLLFCHKSFAGLLLLQYEYQKAMRQVELLTKANAFIDKDSINTKLIPDLCVLTDWGSLEIPHQLLLLEEKDRYDYWSSYQKLFTEYLPLAAYQTNADSLVQKTFNATLLSKGILLNTSRTIQQILQTTEDMNLLDTYKDYQRNMKEYNSLSERNDTLSIFEKIKKKSLNNSIIEQKSKLLSNKYLASLSNIMQITWLQLKSCLEDKDIAIEFINFNVPQKGNIYAALILKKEKESPVMVPLFFDKDMPKISHYPFVDEKWAYKNIWKPLMPYIRGVRNIYFSPVGIMNKFPVEYLPDEQGVTINKIYNMYRLSCTRELLTSREFDATEKINCSAWGGLRYDTARVDISINNDEFRQALIGAKYLPATKKEIMSIENEFKCYGSGCEIVTGNDGTEQNFYRLSGKDFAVIHIATHGYYKTKVNDSIRYDEDEALTRSGLLLSGANNTLIYGIPCEKNNDGILTALEVSRLDLSHVDLVTLSACQTGQGDETSEGILGLQRGFKKAGVQSVLVSLCPVKDEATAIFMTSFYKYYLEFKNKQEALRLAQQSLQAWNKGFYNDFKYWSPFVLIDGLNFSRPSFFNKTILDKVIARPRKHYKINPFFLIAKKNNNQKELTKNNVDKLFKAAQEAKKILQKLIDLNTGVKNIKSDTLTEDETNEALIKLWNDRVSKQENK